jgi:pimeloyl-ACP methyl ester carboxylesterase
MSDAELAASLGFRSEYAEVNGTRLHYVIGGEGDPLVLMGGWPHTWWEFHKVMRPLAEHYEVIVVDIRGMGASAKPETGYDKKTMARDIHELVRSLGHERVDVAGTDIGAMVAHSLAANHPDVVRKLALLDIPHPEESLYELTMLPQAHQPFLWWFAFNQLTDLPQIFLEGRIRPLIDHLCDMMLVDPGAITDADRELYTRAYDSPDAIRASNGWYQTFGQDILDEKTYDPLTLPVLGVASEHNPFLEPALRKQTTGFQFERITGAGHYLVEEKPDEVVAHLVKFFG